MAINILLNNATASSATVAISGTNSYYEVSTIYIKLMTDTIWRTLQVGVKQGQTVSISNQTFILSSGTMALGTYSIIVRIYDDNNGKYTDISYNLEYGYNLQNLAEEVKDYTTSSSFICAVTPILTYGVYYLAGWMNLFYSIQQYERDCTITYSIDNLNISNKVISGKTSMSNFIMGSGAKANTTYIVRGSVSLTYIGQLYSTNFSVTITTKSRPVLFSWLVDKTKGANITDNLLAIEWSGISTLENGNLYYSLQANINLLETHKGLARTDWTGFTANSKGNLTAVMYNKVATAINNLYKIDYPSATTLLKTDYKKGDPVTAQCLNDLVTYLNLVQ